MKSRLRLGIISVSSDALDNNSSESVFNLVNQEIDYEIVEKVIYKNPVSNSQTSKDACNFFNIHNIDLLLIIVGTWTYDNYIIDITQFIKCPIIFLSPPDPLNTPFPRIGSLVGTMQNCGVLTKLNRKVKVILNDLKSGAAIKELYRYIHILHSIKELKLSNIGFIGARCPGMLDTVFNELELRNQIGPEVFNISIAELINGLNSVEEKNILETFSEITLLKRDNSVTDDIIKESVKIFYSVKKIIKNYDLDAIAFQCWPELKNNNICSPCFALSKLADEGIITSCEGDVVAAATMIILKYLTDMPSYLGDLLRINNETNEVLYFHCGAMPAKLAENKEDIIFNIHADPENVWKPGLTVEFPLKPGRITFARLIEMKAKYSLVVYTGESVSSDMFVRGNPAKIKLDKAPEYVVKKLIEEGSGHHQIAVHGDHTEDLKLFCEFLNLDLFLI